MCLTAVSCGKGRAFTLKASTSPCLIPLLPPQGERMMALILAFILLSVLKNALPQDLSERGPRRGDWPDPTPPPAPFPTPPPNKGCESESRWWKFRLALFQVPTRLSTASVHWILTVIMNCNTHATNEWSTFNLHFSHLSYAAIDSIQIDLH